MQYRVIDTHGTGALVVLSGDLDAVGARSIRPLFEDLLERQDDDVVVDLSGVEFMDSSGVGALVFIHKRLVTRNRKLEVVGAVGQPLELIGLLRLDKAISVNTRALILPSTSESVLCAAS